MNRGLDRNHGNTMVVTAFVWGSTYTTHKNAKIYRYWWLFAYYRRELWECSCISVLSKNRSFWISHIDQSAKTRTNWQHSWEQSLELLVLSELLWFQPNNLINTKSVVRDRIPAESHRHTWHNLFSQHKSGAEGAQCLPTSDLPARIQPQKYKFVHDWNFSFPWHLELCFITKVKLSSS